MLVGRGVCCIISFGDDGNVSSITTERKVGGVLQSLSFLHVNCLYFSVLPGQQTMHISTMQINNIMLAMVHEVSLSSMMMEELNNL